MSQKLTDLTYEVPFEKKISRLFIFRFLWIFIEMWVMWVWSIWIGIIGFLHLLYMLFMGRRHEGLWKRMVRYMRHISKWGSYLYAMTDRRPDFIED